MVIVCLQLNLGVSQTPNIEDTGAKLRCNLDRALRQLERRSVPDAWESAA